MSAVVSVLAGTQASCGLLLLAAGAGKAYHAARGGESDTAIRRALRLPTRRWRWVEMTTGAVECVTAVAILAWPVPAGAVMAALGLVFCGLLWYVKAAGIPGGCGCLGGGRRYAAEGVGVRDIIRAAVLAAGGAAGAAAGGNHGAFGRGLAFWTGFLVVSAILVALSVPAPRRACNRPLLSPVRGTLRALTAHLVYQAMAQAAGPFAAEARHRRAGCDDEFWFVPTGGGAPVVFAVGHNGTGGGQGLTIRTARPRAGVTMPARRLPVPVPAGGAMARSGQGA
ncbi:MAG TPA: MauE/DoxX family redox-associated membrane protein [Trebonia sp.]